MKSQYLEVLRSSAYVTLALVSVVASFPNISSWAAQETQVCYVQEVFHFGQDLVLICTPDGLFKATDQGWKKIFSSFDWSEVKAAPSGTIYLYNSETHKVRRSTNGGETWTIMGEAPYANWEGMDHIYPSPLPDTVFLGVWDYPFTPGQRGVYKSANGGITWKKVLEGGNGRWVAFSPSFVQDGTAFAALDEYHTALGIWKTKDWGETWYPVNDGLYTGGGSFGHMWVAVSPQFHQDQTVFTSDSSGLYKTVNGGESWERVENQAFAQVVFSPDYAKDQVLLLRGYDNILYLSRDGGETRQILHSEYVSAVGVRRPGPFGMSPVLSSPPGCHCSYLPFVSRHFTSNLLNELEFWVVSRKDEFGGIPYLYRSTDYGTAWEPVPIYSQLIVAKYANLMPVPSGGSLTYTLRVTNTGSVILHATITDTLPTYIISGTTAHGSAILPGGTLTWRPTITAPDGIWTETIVVTVEKDYIGPLTNVVEVSSVEGATGIYANTVTVRKPWVYLPIVRR